MRVARLPGRTAPPIPTAPVALFLDFDGTVVDFAATPDAVAPDPGLTAQLKALHDVLEGAIAIVSGRPIVALDQLLCPLKLPMAGIHGLERRTAAGSLHPAPPGAAWLASMRTELARFVSVRPGLLLEDKGVSLALHFRQAPHHEAAAHALVDALLGSLAADAKVIRGNAVVEVCPAGCDKALALEAFLMEAPFAGRRPVYLGDDTNDLGAMRMAEDRGGLAIAVGDRIEARWRLPEPADVRAWLGALIAERSRS